jgi:hypothetical protein
MRDTAGHWRWLKSFKGSRIVLLKLTHCYADLFHGGIAMPNSDLLPSLLFKINQNQLALEAAIMELTLWVEQLDQVTLPRMFGVHWKLSIETKSSSI